MNRPHAREFIPAIVDTGEIRINETKPEGQPGV